MNSHALIEGTYRYTLMRKATESVGVMRTSILHPTNKIEAVRPLRSAQAGTALPFNLLLLYLLFEFGRPQEAVPGLAALKPSMIVVIPLFVQLLRSRGQKFTDITTKLFLVLLVLMFFHIPFAVNNFWAFHTFRAMAMTFVSYLSIVIYVDTPQRFKKLINVWLGIHVFL
jgi:hypothetical protein